MKMENEKNSLIIEEPSISYYSTIFNFGIQSKSRKTPQNLFKSFSPLSSNRGISFSNTIMYPLVTTESILDQKKNISRNKQNKSKTIIVKDNTELKTELTKDEENTEEKEVIKLLIDNDNDTLSDIEESYEKFLEQKTKHIEFENRKKSHYVKNPFYQGVKTQLTLKELNNQENNNKKLNKIYNERIEDNNFEFKERRNSYLKTIGTPSRKKNKMKITKMKSFNITQAEKIKGFERKQAKHHSLRKVTKDSKDEENNLRASKTINKEHVKFQKQSLFNKNNSNRYKGKMSAKINLRFKREEKKKEESVVQKKEKKINNEKITKEPELKAPAPDPKEDSNVKVNKKKLNRKILSVQNGFSKSNLKISGLSLKSEKKKTHSSKKKIARKTSDFEKALKNNKNLANTQFNLFSPDRFTNTQFCGSDFCDYTLDCMDIILNKNKSQRQQKQKVNLNFQKSVKNKIKKKIALFDLDETLVHCTGDINNKDGETYQHCIEISLPGNKETKVGINIRPHWKKTLNLIKKYYHIAIFTASHQAYADAVLDFMDPGKKYFKYRLYRNNCSLVDVDGTKFYVKDLDIFDEYYNLKDIVIIDNSVLSFIYHLENGIPIVPYYNEDKDGSLYIVGLYLMHIYKEDDLRVANKKYINLDSFLNEARTRKETESTINEEPSDVETSNKKDTKVENKDEENDELKNNNNNTPLHKIMVNEYNNNTNSFTNTMYLHHTGDSTPQNRLIKNSRLFNVYYEFNPTNTRNNMEEIIEEKSNKSNSSDDEKIYNTNDNRFSYNIKGWCFSKMMQTADYKPVENKKGYKTSKGFCISADLKKIKDTFDIKFSN